MNFFFFFQIYRNFLDLVFSFLLCFDNFCLNWILSVQLSRIQQHYILSWCTFGKPINLYHLRPESNIESKSGPKSHNVVKKEVVKSKGTRRRKKKEEPLELWQIQQTLKRGDFIEVSPAFTSSPGDWEWIGFQPFLVLLLLLLLQLLFLLIQICLRLLLLLLLLFILLLFQGVLTMNLFRGASSSSSIMAPVSLARGRGHLAWRI